MCVFVRALLDVHDTARRQCKGRMRWESPNPGRHTTHRTRATLTSRHCSDGRRPSKHLLSDRRGGECMTAGQLAAACNRVTLRVGPVCVGGGVCVCVRVWCLVE